MGSLTFPEEKTKDLLDAQTHIWAHVFYYLNSMALKCAIQLGIPDTIHRHGKPMTLNDLATSLAIPPNKTPSLNRLMRLLVSSNFFSVEALANKAREEQKQEQEQEQEPRFGLTLSSQLLVKDHPLTQAPFALTLLDQTITEPSHYLSNWFESDAVRSSFVIKHGASFWELAGLEPKFNDIFNQAMESDSRLVTSLLVSSEKFKRLFEGVESLVDVGGGVGTTAKAISEAFPWLKTCIVLDLPHVVEQGLRNIVGNVKFVAGDMLEAVPHADAVLLKWILHDWSDDNCIKILKQCKEAISRKGGSKVIIIDIVVKPQIERSMQTSPELLFDILMMSVLGEGKERTEEEWMKLFIKSGFSDYKIHPILGLRSVIELYPY